MGRIEVDTRAQATRAFLELEMEKMEVCRDISITNVAMENSFTDIPESSKWDQS